jgi:hypothetical protein
VLLALGLGRGWDFEGLKVREEIIVILPVLALQGVETDSLGLCEVSSV